MKKLLLVILILSGCAITIFAQPKVKSMKETTDFIPADVQRKDYNQDLCALVKVQVVDDITSVEGNVMGDIVKKGVEKWVYMSKDSRNIKIHLKNNLPVTILFRDYAINGLKSNRVYELIIETPGANDNEMQTFVLNYSPANATVLIDSKPYNGNGHIEQQLSLGEHKYTIASVGFHTVEGNVTLTGRAPREITEKLVAVDNPPEPYSSQFQSQVIEPSAIAYEEGKKQIKLNDVTITMLLVKGGTFVMGEPDARVIRKASLSDYYIGETEVTQELWLNVMGRNPSDHLGFQYPVENVSWMDCKEFIERLNNLTGFQFRLPTEAEWEFAARGGLESRGYNFPGSNKYKDVAKGGFNTYEVAKKQPNELGIYDMAGNVSEWCEDWYGELFVGSMTNPKGPNSGKCRVVRGGRFGQGFKYNVYKRIELKPSKKINNVGLRLAM